MNEMGIQKVGQNDFVTSNGIKQEEQVPVSKTRVGQIKEKVATVLNYLFDRTITSKYSCETSTPKSIKTASQSPNRLPRNFNLFKKSLSDVTQEAMVSI
jgi:hypothetical protein